MKKITLIVLIAIVAFACSSDDLKEGDSKDVVTQQVLPGQNVIKQVLHSFSTWRTANLATVFSKSIEEDCSFTFDKSFFTMTLGDRTLENYRFSLGVKNNKLQIVCMGVDDENEVISSIFKVGTLNTGAVNLTDVDTQKPPFDASNAEEDVKKHILQIKDAIPYLYKWKNALQDTENLEDKVSYDGMRIKHFTIDKDAIAFLVNRDNVTKVELVLGLNEENKMTTVFFGKNNKNVIFDEDAVNFALDFTAPCPSECDPR